ncbi:polysaccharide deacetylase family protein [Lacibacterium aquatile]|uniref:Polysaccharide deacetylase family protein n=1 Tax=Lacibacterium aquatile TaxID=1168082 RepID=A0ABW5DRP0_9PROT
MSEVFTPLLAELDLWRAAGRTATLWWRDDDAVKPTAQLERLIDLSHRGVPCGLAVVPEPAVRELAVRLLEEPFVEVLQHGFAHTNHAPPEVKSAEFGAHRDLEDRVADLCAGRDKLWRLFGEKFVPVLVPPWNRIGEDLLPELAQIGYRGLSTFEPRKAAGAYGYVPINTHVDPIAWRAGKTFRGAEHSLKQLAGHLSRRRLGEVDPEEATGLLTHHLVHEESLWQFLEDLFAVLADRREVSWLAPSQMWG